MTILAAELGLLARDIRAEEKQNPDNRGHATMQNWHERIGVWQDTVRRAWDAQVPASMANGYSNQILPVGDRGIFEHVSVVTSFFPFFIFYEICCTWSIVTGPLVSSQVENLRGKDSAYNGVASKHL